MDIPKTVSSTVQKTLAERSATPPPDTHQQKALQAFSQRLFDFSQMRDTPTSDRIDDRMHTSHCLEAAVRCITMMDKFGESPDRTVSLDFGCYKAAIASITPDLISGLVDLAKSRNCSISNVVLPEGLKALPPWLNLLPDVQNLQIDKFEGESLDVRALPNLNMMDLGGPTNASLSVLAGPNTSVRFR